MGEGKSVRSFVVVHNRDLESFFVVSTSTRFPIQDTLDVFVVSLVVSFVENFVASTLYHLFLDPQEKAPLFPGKRRSSRQRTGDLPPDIQSPNS